MKKKTRLQKSTTALLIAAVLLILSGTVGAARAALNIQSEFYRAQFYLNHLQVHLLENGEDVCSRAGHQNNLDGSAKTTGELATKLGYEHKDGKGERLGSVEPGKVYQEEIAARNSTDIDEFVRMTIRKYWVATDENGNVVTETVNGVTQPVKITQLNPAQIHLMYGGKDGYNTSAWMENEAERTDESSTYYYKSVLNAGKDTELLFDKLMIDSRTAELGRIIESEKDGVKTFTYEYKYDGCAFYIEADVQAIQTHNINDAIRSQWGVDKLTGTYDDATHSGSLKFN